LGRGWRRRGTAAHSRSARDLAADANGVADLVVERRTACHHHRLDDASHSVVRDSEREGDGTKLA